MSLKNDDFRRLLSTPSTKPRTADSSARQGPSSSAPNNKRNDNKKPQFKKKFYNNKKKDEEEKTDIDKIYDESQQHLVEIMKGYRDRAAERRKADTNKESDEATLRLMIHGIMPADLESTKGLTIEQSKLLGGDMENTHMVKGLDYALLEKMKNDKEESDEEEAEEKDVPASSLAPEKVAKHPMVRRVIRTVFHTTYPKRNEHFAPGRMAYVCDFENQDNDVPSTLLRSLDETPKENPSVKTDKLILEHLTNILPYLRDKKREKKKKKHVNDEEEVKAMGDIKIFDDAGEYDTKVKPLKQDKNRHDKDSAKEGKKSYFDDRDDRRSKRDDDHRRESDKYRRRDDDSRSRRGRSPDRRDRDRDRRRERTPDSFREKDRKDESRKSSSLADKLLEARKRAASPSQAEPKPAKKRIGQDEAYGEYYAEDMDFVETIASDDDDDEALAMAKARMFHELGTDGTEKKGKKGAFDKKKPNISKADAARKLDNELKKMDEIWANKKDSKINY